MSCRDVSQPISYIPRSTIVLSAVMHCFQCQESVCGTIVEGGALVAMGSSTVGFGAVMACVHVSAFLCFCDAAVSASQDTDCTIMAKRLELSWVWQLPDLLLDFLDYAPSARRC